MSVTPDSEIRTNRLGQPCPTWCTTDHDQLVIDGQPKYGFVLGHNSDYMTIDRPGWGAVKVSRYPREEAKVRLDGAKQIHLTPEQADALAQILEDRNSLSGIGHLIDELRTAAQIARDTN